MAETRDERIQKFADAVARSAIVYCSPAIFDAIQANSEHVAKFAGCEIRASKWCESDTLYAVVRRPVTGMQLSDTVHSEGQK